MSAAYKPYKDEDSLDSVQNLEEEILNWSDHEPSSIRIYEKTTEELPFAMNRKYSLVCFMIGFVCAFVGYLFGYLGHSHPNQCILFGSKFDTSLNITDQIITAVDSESIEKFVHQFSSKPRIPGSEVDIDLSQKVTNYFTQYHFDKVKVQEKNVVISIPDEQEPNHVSIIDTSQNSTIYSSLTDSTEDNSPPFSYCAYSPAGDVTGDLLFVNNGNHEDYMFLIDKLKINISGKVLIAKQWDLSAKEQLILAQQHNAAALLLFPDPAVYNNKSGILFPANAVKRESVYGVGIEEVPSEFHFFHDKVASLTPVLVQPISQNVAFRFLSLLAGPTVPEELKKGIDVKDLSFGPGFKSSSYQIRVRVNNQLVNRTIRNIVGIIEGSLEPDRYVILGNHRDSWLTGAVDAASGTGVLLELAKVFGGLRKQGWRPLRSIMFCSWGAEEFNLIGINEWIEENVNTLRYRAIAYINVDIIMMGNDSLSAYASPLLFDAIFNATLSVSNPQSLDTAHKSVYDKWLNTFPKKQAKETKSEQSNYEIDTIVNEIDKFKQRLKQAIDRNSSTYLLHSYYQSAFSEKRPLIKPLNDITMYAPFFFNLAIPVAEFHYVDSNDTLYPLMHTQYDTFEVIKTMLDPNFTYHQAVARVIALLVHSLSDSQYLPFNLLNYVQEWQNAYIIYHAQFGHILSNNGISTELLNSTIHDFFAAASRFHLCQQKIDLKNPLLVRILNDQLLLTERAFLALQELPASTHRHYIHTSNEFIHANFEYHQTFPSQDLSQDTRSILQSELSLFVHSIQSVTNLLGDILCDN